LYGKRTDLERQYMRYKFPHFKDRKPRKLEDFDDWKAVELR